MNILLAVDGSKNSLDAVASVIRHADWYAKPPTVNLLYVHLPVPKIGSIAGGPSRSSLERYYREEGEECLAKAKKLLDKSGLPYKESILVGQIAETICKQADALGCDLICMGTRGLGAAANLVVGSVATKVLHAAKVPVLLVK
jgi:nucleotide-binding universal stress UspA family protein